MNINWLFPAFQLDFYEIYSYIPKAYSLNPAIQISFKDFIMAETLGKFNYFQWKPMFREEKPYYLYTDPPPGYPNANFSTQPGEAETVHDVRGREKEFNLDDNAFAFARQEYPHSLKDLDEVTIKTQYLPSLEVMIRQLLQQDCEIFWFDWRVRSPFHLINPLTDSFTEGRAIMRSRNSRMVQSLVLRTALSPWRP